MAPGDHPLPGEAAKHFCTQRVRVYGVLHGVGFGQACCDKAATLRLSGGLRNRQDGSIETTLQGTRKCVDMMCEWIVHGDHDALIERIEIAELTPPFVLVTGFQADLI